MSMFIHEYGAFLFGFIAGIFITVGIYNECGFPIEIGIRIGEKGAEK